jgi:hypothetical protein
MVEIKLYEDDKTSALNHNQDPSRVMVVPSIDIDNRRRILTVPSVNGKELLSFYFLQYYQESGTFYFYKVDEKTN